MKNEEYKKRALDLLSYELAADDLGNYPASVQKGDKVTKRTAWQEGWNACSMALTDKAGEIDNYLDSLPEEIKDYILREVVTVSVRDGSCSMSINCNDLFYWACADEEDFKLNDLPDLKRAYQESPENGGILWVCRKRKMRPQKPYYKYLKNDKKLFDACGSERQE